MSELGRTALHEAGEEANSSTLHAGGSGKKLNAALGLLVYFQRKQKGIEELKTVVSDRLGELLRVQLPGYGEAHRQR